MLDVPAGERHDLISQGRRGKRPDRNGHVELPEKVAARPRFLNPRPHGAVLESDPRHLPRVEEERGDQARPLRRFCQCGKQEDSRRNKKRAFF